MPEIITDSKPISFETIHRSFDSNQIGFIVSKISAPIAVIDGDRLVFYICNPDYLTEAVSSSFTFNTLIDTYLDIPNKADLIPRLQAYQALRERHQREYFDIVRKFKEADTYSIDALEQQFKNEAE